MLSLMSLKITFLGDREKKKKYWTLVDQKYVARLVLFFVHICQMVPHSKPTILNRKLCTQPLLCSMLLLDLSAVEACGGGKNSVFAVLQDCLSQKKVLTQIFCFLFVCLCVFVCGQGCTYIWNSGEQSCSEPAFLDYSLAYR